MGNKDDKEEINKNMNDFMCTASDAVSVIGDAINSFITVAKVNPLVAIKSQGKQNQSTSGNEDHMDIIKIKRSSKADDDDDYTEVVIRMDEKLKGIVDTLRETLQENATIRREFTSDIKELTVHVNYEDNLLAARVKLLENCSADSKAEKKGAMFVYKVAIAIMGSLLTLLAILRYFGVF